MKTKYKSAAVLTIHNASKMSKRGRRDIISWLRKQANTLDKYHTHLSSRWTARYLYPAK